MLNDAELTMSIMKSGKICSAFNPQLGQFGASGMGMKSAAQYLH
jgi:hypothetical protein